MRPYLKRALPVQVRNENREVLHHATSRPGKTIEWERVGILKLGQSKLKNAKFLSGLTSVLVFSLADGTELVCYDHRPDVVARVRRFVSKEIGLEKVLERIELESRVELMKKVVGGREIFYLNFYSRPAKTKATSNIVLDTVLKSV